MRGSAISGPSRPDGAPGRAATWIADRAPISSHARGAATHQRCAPLRHRVSRGRAPRRRAAGGPGPPVKADEPMRAIWHIPCVAANGRVNVDSSGIRNFDRPGNGLFLGNGVLRTWSSDRVRRTPFLFGGNDMLDKATRIDLFSLRSVPMRAFHLTWLAFFICFFAWFACAPLMPVIAREFALTPDQIANINIAAVAATIAVRLLVGPLCDRYGPRRVYTGLLAIGALPVIAVAFSHDYTSFLLCRLGIGAVGASFVITQYHTSVMFAPNVVGTANATTAGWGNAGAGAAQALVPLLFAAALLPGFGASFAWRSALIVPGLAMLGMAWLYWRHAQDGPQGDFATLRAQGVAIDSGKKGGWASFTSACRNYRVWMLCVTYGACFGVEVFMHNIAALYYVNHFHLSLRDAGLAAGMFGLLALFARAFGGWLSDRTAARFGLEVRAPLLAVLIVGEGLGLLAFAHAGGVAQALAAMLVFGLFTHMACGATYALVPFVDRRALGGVAGIVGAGGNAGAVAAGFLLKGLGDVQQTLTLLGICVSVTALCALVVRFSAEHRAREAELHAHALAVGAGSR
jgi:NNP family nitrate/nitrite transporter-like MFS transporter